MTYEFTIASQCDPDMELCLTFLNRDPQIQPNILVDRLIFVTGYPEIQPQRCGAVPGLQSHLTPGAQHLS